LGSKQVCPNCQAKFYDLLRRPAVCPKCATAFDPEEAVKSRRNRARTTTPDYEDAEETPAKVVEDQDGFEDEVDDTPEIDAAVDAEPMEVDDLDSDGVSPPNSPDDSDLEEEGDDVPFLEDEDEDFPEDEIEGLPGEGDLDN
jgi:uncharacterized protein (TIGR02300 family)